MTHAKPLKANTIEATAIAANSDVAEPTQKQNGKQNG
jgi:hypothetical protein